MKSWKTMTGGVLLAVGSWASGQVEVPWLWKLGPLFQTVGGIFLSFGRDNNVPSEAVPKAAERADEIKRDTEFINRMKGN